MRILELRLKNLNSLEGEWRLDFTHPAFVRDGIFAITGPTGSGKSTILDAICLALYGCTPRLGKITKSQNEIMSRRAGECAAEIVFETEEGRFRCHWSQHRARKKPGGELQNQKHEASDADTKKILASGIKDTADFVEEKTGLNFDRFTRSMLLAQGGFAAFLQAGPDERSPILEEITGTEIYSRISMATHERAASEKKELELLKREVSGLNLLGGEARETLEKEIAAKKDEEEKLSSEIARLSACIFWHESMQRLGAELSGLREEEEKLQQAKEAFKPFEVLLRRAISAMGLSPEFTGLQSLRGELKREEGETENLEKSLPDLRKNLEEAEKLLEEVRAEGVKLLERHGVALPKIRQARDLDLQIREGAKFIRKLEGEMAENSKALIARKTGYQKNCGNLRDKRERLQRLEVFFAENAADGVLAKEFTGIREHFLQLESLVKERAVSAKKQQAAATEIERREKVFADKSLLLEKSRLSMEDAGKSAEEAAKKLEELLCKKDLGLWRRDLDTLQEREKILAHVEEALAHLDNAEKEMAGIRKKREAYLQEEETLLVQKSHREKELDLFSEQEKLLEKEMLLFKKIRSLEEERAQLKAGDPCPLCGSMDHPYADGEPIPEDGETKREETRKNIFQLRNIITELQIRQAEMRKSLEHLESREKELADQGASKAAFVEKVRRSHDFFTENPDTEPKTLMEKNRKALEEMRTFVSRAETLEKSRSDLERKFWEKKETFFREEALFLKIRHERDKAFDNRKVLEEASQELLLRFEASMDALQKSLAPLGEPLPAPEDFGKTLETLNSRKKIWEKRIGEKDVLEREIIALSARLEKEEEVIANLESFLLKQKEESAHMVGENEALMRERFALFGEKNPDAEEAAFKAGLASSEQKQRKAEAWARTQEKEVQNVETRLSHLRKSMDERRILLLQREKTFCKSLAASGFLDEADFVSSRMDEERFKALSEKENALAKASHSLQARKKEKEELLLKESEKNLTEEDEVALKERFSSKKERERVLQLETGGLLARLSEDSRLREKLKSLIESCKTREREVRRWELLDSLIGSHDGKKYRNFVQGLTLELVVRHANHHLQKITDRYILVRDETHPLDLQVVDTWQADEIRSTKNLSGGESFLVSLALALGLSRMSGNNIRMDSLFLDEGFGTLDEDALEVALSALSSLRSEGKLIGLISHVAELKERIPTRIELISSREGKSRIHGPGCLEI